MIKIGLRSEFEFVPEASALGFDYLELPLTRICALTDDEFEELAAYIEGTGINIEAMYDMLPDDLRVNGNDVRAQLQHAYLEKAFFRAKRLGAKVIAFDAPAARNVPPVFDFAMARRQTGNFLRIVQGHAVGYDLQVAIQNYRHAQCNLINTASEAALMAALLQLSQVGVLADTVQMAYAAEPVEALIRCGSSLMHVHTGSPITRDLPSSNDGEDYVKLFRTLMRKGYQGRVSATTSKECTLESARAALDCLKKARQEAQS